MKQCVGVSGVMKGGKEEKEKKNITNQNGLHVHLQFKSRVFCEKLRRIPDQKSHIW
jgi:hypothetical protein